MEKRGEEELHLSIDVTEAGIVLFERSMQLRYANDQARSFMTRVDNRKGLRGTAADLRVEIIKLGVQIREQDWDGGPRPSSEREAKRIVKTAQGSFRLRALIVPARGEPAIQQILVVIEDRRNGRPASEGGGPTLNAC